MLPELEEVARRRKALGMTQERLAKQARVSRSLIAKLETQGLVPNYVQAKGIFDLLESLEKEQAKKLSLINITVGQLHNLDIEYAEANEPVSVVFDRMSSKAYSQVPVREDDRIIGSLTERGINRLFFRQDLDHVKTLSARAAMERPFPILDVTTPVSLVVSLLQTYQAVLTTAQGKIVGIVTNTDLSKVFIQH